MTGKYWVVLIIVAVVAIGVYNLSRPTSVTFGPLT